MRRRRALRIRRGWETDLRTVNGPGNVVKQIDAVVAAKPKRRIHHTIQFGRRAFVDITRSFGRAWDEWAPVAIWLSAIAALVAFAFMLPRPSDETTTPTAPSPACRHDRKMIAALRPHLAAAERAFVRNPLNADTEYSFDRLRGYMDEYRTDRAFDC